MTTRAEFEKLVHDYAGAYASDYTDDGPPLVALLTAVEATLKDAERWRAINKYLSVERDVAGEWTCWLELECVPWRSQTTDVNELADKLVKSLAGNCPVLTVKEQKK